MTDGAVNLLLVVDRDSAVGDDANLIETLERIGIQYFDTEGAVEPFAVGVLCRTTALVELSVEGVGLGLRLYNVAAKLQAIVNTHPRQNGGRLLTIPLKAVLENESGSTRKTI